ncbi:hypothetical protein CHU92_01600 [Flavobacterium cyanobacteriorum]|uniref:SprT-like domain-containing protein n=1 Tax=Flavobacterium cyanobacteriorum TaxID=2022802 RepID=A0A255ZZ23_9FLAO|nr:hypothetical protein [Flavobacterium cyanobacteriorum]OYQ46135.1 hypothetical protein CHU92_01600 [Flavobacterium cyanobacteriorum]
MKKLLPLAILLLASLSCSTEDKAVTEENGRFFSKKNAGKDQIIYKRVKKAALPNPDLVNSILMNIRQNSDPQFFIDDAIALYAGYEGTHTLTFPTYRTDGKSETIQNIVLQSADDGEYDAYLFSYSLTTAELDTWDKIGSESIRSRTEITSLSAGSGPGMINISCFEPVQNYIGRWECEAGNEHAPGDPSCSVGGSRWVMRPATQSWVYVGCADSGGGSTGGGGNTGGGGSTGGGGAGPRPRTTIVTQPIMLDPAIFQIILDESFTENDCLMGVYNQLGGSPTFQEYLQNFDGEFSVAHLKLKSSSTLSSTTNAETASPNNYLITITFNSNNLSRPALSIARTIIHEIIHAEIYRKLLSIAGQPNIEFTQAQLEILRNNYPGLYDYYMRYEFNVPAGQQVSDAQHQMMAQHYRGIIVQALKEFNNNVSDEVYEAIAWEGLKNTVAWNNLTQAEKEIIDNTITNFENSNSNCQ